MGLLRASASSTRALATEAARARMSARAPARTAEAARATRPAMLRGSCSTITSTDHQREVRRLPHLGSSERQRDRVCRFGGSATDGSRRTHDHRLRRGCRQLHSEPGERSPETAREWWSPSPDVYGAEQTAITDWLNAELAWRGAGAPPPPRESPAQLSVRLLKECPAA